MPRPRKYIESGSVYEICFRAKKTLPLVAHRCIKFLIQSIIARVQRDHKVTLCHDIWNGSHPHLIVVSKDAKKFVEFYGEIQKQITEAIKRLLGMEHLEIWEGNVSVIKLGDPETVMNRIAYLYANPGQDDLEESIERFPGASSWSDFQVSLEKLGAKVSHSYPWVRLPSIPRLSSDNPSRRENEEVIKHLRAANKVRHSVIRYPNAWMKCFGYTKDSEAAASNASIIQKIRQREEVAREERKKEERPVMGAARLERQPILKPHTPKKKERKIYIITTVVEVFNDFTDRMKRFNAACKECLARWKAGDLSVEWPPEAFKPPLPPVMNLLPTY